MRSRAGILCKMGVGVASTSQRHGCRFRGFCVSALRAPARAERLRFSIAIRPKSARLVCSPSKWRAARSHPPVLFRFLGEGALNIGECFGLGQRNCAPTNREVDDLCSVEHSGSDAKP